MSKTVKPNHPLAELLAKKLMGIEIVPQKEQTKMVRNAIKAAVEYVEKLEDKMEYMCRDCRWTDYE